MLTPDFLLTISTPEIENANLFPFPFGLHLIFCTIALIFFGWRFSVQKKPFQLIFAIAVPLSLAIWLNDSKNWFYIIGLTELILILAAFVSCFIFKGKDTEENIAENTDEESDDAADDNSDPEAEDAESSEESGENE